MNNRNAYNAKHDGFLYSANATWQSPDEEPLGVLVSDSPIPNAVQVTDGQKWMRLVAFRPNPHPRPSQVEVDEKARGMEDRRLALFVWQHFTDEATYESRAAEQDHKCATCQCDLKVEAITHFVEGSIYCRRCSGRKPRYGIPS